jgi:hypothetical protein
MSAKTNIKRTRAARLKGDALFAALTNPPAPANRAERRERDKRLRRLVSARRTEEREVHAKRIHRAMRKTRRAARLPLGPE